MDLDFAAHRLIDLKPLNVILGKNGCGKSSVLRLLENTLRNQAGSNVKYVTPERGGSLKFDGNVETNLQSHHWGESVRSSNRFDSFRQLSVSEFRRLETLVLRQIESTAELRADSGFTFDTTVREINDLLDNIELVRSENGAFSVRNIGQDQFRNVDTLSSGESELISLAIECLSFCYASKQPHRKDATNILLLDEPDVHIHPDLQHRLMQLIAKAVGQSPVTAIISTHSTSVLSGLSQNGEVGVAFMKKGDEELTFVAVDDALKMVMPIFGAHPLSNVFNERPILLVEGEDDERIWQQVVRSSNGRINVWPCVAGDVQSLTEFEAVSANMLEAVYDSARAFSLRDRDDSDGEITDLGPVERFRLNCRAAENLLLTDDVLMSCDLDWPSMVVLLNRWLAEFVGHKQHDAMNAFRQSGWDRNDFNLKTLRNICAALMGITKPWEVAVGQAIASMPTRGVLAGDHTLDAYLGAKLVSGLNLR